MRVVPAIAASLIASSVIWVAFSTLNVERSRVFWLEARRFRDGTVDRVQLGRGYEDFSLSERSTRTPLQVFMAIPRPAAVAAGTVAMPGGLAVWVGLPPYLGAAGRVLGLLAAIAFSVTAGTRVGGLLGSLWPHRAIDARLLERGTRDAISASETRWAMVWCVVAAGPLGVATWFMGTHLSQRRFVTAVDGFGPGQYDIVAIALLLCIGAAFAAGAGTRRALARLASPLGDEARVCWRCGYGLGGMRGTRCPECGRENDAHTVRGVARRRYATLAAAVAIVAIPLGWIAGTEYAERAEYASRWRTQPRASGWTDGIATGLYHNQVLLRVGDAVRLGWDDGTAYLVPLYTRVSPVAAEASVRVVWVYSGDGGAVVGSGVAEECRGEGGSAWRSIVDVVFAPGRELHAEVPVPIDGSVWVVGQTHPARVLGRLVDIEQYPSFEGLPPAVRAAWAVAAAAAEDAGMEVIDVRGRRQGWWPAVE